MKCSDCRYYEAAGSKRYSTGPEGFGHCARWHEGYGVEIEDVAKNEALVENDEGWGNIVGPDFGCVLFEQSYRK